MENIKTSRIRSLKVIAVCWIATAVLLTTVAATRKRFLPSCTSFTDSHQNLNELYTYGPGESQSSTGCVKPNTYVCYQHPYHQWIDSTTMPVTIYLQDLSPTTPPGDSTTGACQVSVAYTYEATCS